MDIILKKNQAIALIQDEGKKAIDSRRYIADSCNLETLSEVDKSIFVSSTKKQIKDYEDRELAENLKTIFKFIAIDVGYNTKVNEEEWIYQQIRLTDVIKKYYSYMTLREIKIAFELCATGVLDSYLGKDSQGNPDRKHYQCFSTDFFCKIINAYLKRRNETFNKVFKALPLQSDDIASERRRSFYEARMKKRREDIFLHYKKTGELVLDFSDAMMVYNWLVDLGYSAEFTITEDDRKKAYALYLQKATKGIVNKYEAEHVRRDGPESPELDFQAFDIARKNEIKRAFDRMIKDKKK